MTKGRALTNGQRSVQTAIRWSPDLLARIRAHSEFHALPVTESIRRLVAQGLGLLPLDQTVLDAQESGHVSQQ